MAGEELRLLFLDTQDFERGAAVRGGALVTDAATEPVEFRCTSPVRPTLLQKTLWGGRLESHIAARLTGKPLIDALTNSPSVVLVRKREFLELRELLKVPLVLLLAKGEPTGTPSLSKEAGEDESFGKLVLKVHPAYPNDFGGARALLADVSSSHDLLDPFSRVRNALDLVEQQEAANPGSTVGAGWTMRSQK